MRNPWDYPPTDGFTDTYEYSKGLQDDLNYLQKGYMNKNITSFDDGSLIDEGIGDYLAGTESYAMRYFQGQLISNQIVGFNQINGSEGLLAAITTKIKQFFKWLASLFTKDKNKTIIKVTPVPTPTVKNQKLHPTKLENLVNKYEDMNNHWKSVYKSFMEINEKLAESTGALKDEFPAAYQGLNNLDTHKFNQSIDQVTSGLEGMGAVVAKFENSDQLVGFVKSKQQMLWNALIATFDSRVKIASMDAINGISEQAYETALKTRTGWLKEEKDQKRVTNNLVEISRFTAKLNTLRVMTDTLDKILKDVIDGFYVEKS